MTHRLTKVTADCDGTIPSTRHKRKQIWESSLFKAAISAWRQRVVRRFLPGADDAKISVELMDAVFHKL